MPRKKAEDIPAQISDLMNELVPHQRPGWTPETVEGDGAMTDSKFAGIPYLPEGVEWPVSPLTQEPMPLFLQLNSEQLPPEAGKPFGDGILQLFYATDEDTEQEYEGWEAFSKASVARVVPYSGEGKAFAENPIAEPLAARRIVGWKQREELPDSEDARLLGIDYDYTVWEAMEDEELPEPDDKLLGWPSWVQGEEYPDCPESGEPMKFLFQIGSEQNLDFLFGDVGTGYLMQSPVNPQLLTFLWQCG